MNEEQRPVVQSQHTSQPVKKSKKMDKKTIMIIGAIVLALIVAGIIAFIMLNANKGGSQEDKVRANFEKQLPDQKTAVDKNPKDAGARFNLGSTYYALKKYGDAAKELEKAVELDSKNTQAYNGLGNAYREQKRYDDAAAAYKKAIEADPKNKNAYVNLGTMQMTLMKDTKGAVATYDRMMKEFKNSVDTMTLKAVALNADGQKDAAKDLYKKILEKDPENASAKASLEALK